MGYLLGIDVGTTFTAAAINRDGRVEMVSLGQHTSVIPTLVYVREDGEMLIGEAAARRGVTDPARLAREFKRRIGDTAPLILGSSPYSPERLTAAVLRHVVDTVSQLEGGPPDRVALTYPANWGNFKIEVLRGAARLAELPDTVLLTEPLAAGVQYASAERIEDAAVIAVYDLGGGTFDAAVLRKQGDSWEQLGNPEGIEHLGGVDFDQAVVNHVRTALGPAFDALDQTDPNVRTAVTRLMADCVGAKEALSSDAEASIPVILPGLQSEIRLTRGEFEGMIRPTVRDSVDALRRAIASAGVQPADLHAVLLVGGSSRIPLVSELVASELGRPVAVDAHPKHAVALGAARMAATGAVSVPAAATPPPPSTPAPPADSTSPGADTGPTAAVAAGAAGAAAAAAAGGGATPPRDRGASGSRPKEGPPAPRKRRRDRTIAAVLGAVVVILAVVAVVIATSGGGGGGNSGASSPPTTGATATTRSNVPNCTSQSGRCAFITNITFDKNTTTYLATYVVKGFEPIIYTPGHGKPTDHHVHFFYDTVGADHAGSNTAHPGIWQVWDRDAGHGQLLFNAYNAFNQNSHGGLGAKQLCILVADANHGVEQGSGNCVNLPPTTG
jgi:actin-like ATPase involved in cell morphogenesis